MAKRGGGSARARRCGGDRDRRCYTLNRSGATDARAAPCYRGKARAWQLFFHPFVRRERSVEHRSHRKAAPAGCRALALACLAGRAFGVVLCPSGERCDRRLARRETLRRLAHAQIAFVLRAGMDDDATGNDVGAGACRGEQLELALALHLAIERAGQGDRAGVDLARDLSRLGDRQLALAVDLAAVLAIDAQIALGMEHAIEEGVAIQQARCVARLEGGVSGHVPAPPLTLASASCRFRYRRAASGSGYRYTHLRAPRACRC